MLFLVYRHSSLLCEIGLTCSRGTIYACIILYHIPPRTAVSLHNYRDGLHFFPNGERVLYERLSFPILSTIFQVGPCVIQQCCCIIKRDLPPFDEFFTLECMRKIALTARPGCRFIERKDLVDCSYYPFCPLTLCLLVHLILDDGLHETMNAERLGCGIAADE